MRALGLVAWFWLLSALSGGCGRDERLPPRVLPRDAGGEPNGSSPSTPPPTDAELDDTGPPEGSDGHDAALPPEGIDMEPSLDASASDAASVVEAGVPEAGPAEATESDPRPRVLRVTGRWHVPSGFFLDVDFPGLDPLGDRRSNDRVDTSDRRLDEAQPLSRPAWVAGHLGPLASDASGALAASPDDSVDYFRVSLERGDRVTLRIFADPANEGAPIADLDLYLLDAQNHDIAPGGRWVDDSLGTDALEQVVAPRTGEYWIAVQRVESADDDQAAARYTLEVAVPRSRAEQELIASSKLSSKVPLQEHRVLVRLSPGPPSAAVHAALPAPSPENAIGYRSASLTALGRGATARRADARETLYAIKRLRREPGVHQAAPVIRFQPQAVSVPNDPDLERQWALWPIDLFAGWAESERGVRAAGEGVIVAVVDTGVVRGHPDFVAADGTSQLLQGYDMISDPESARDGDGRDPDPEDPGDRAVPGGGTFHGTHCAGTIAAAADNGVGVVGIAPRAKILPVRVMGQGGGVLDDVVEGILYAAGLPNASGALPERGADVINSSLAGPGRSTVLAEAIAAARAAGSLVVASAGNYASPAEAYTPAAEPGVITVSAAAAPLSLAWYSNYGESDGVIDLVGIGGDLLQDHTLDGYPDGIWGPLHRDGGNTLFGYVEGTSMSAAQVSGVAALMKGVWPEMTPEAFAELLPELVVDLGAPGYDREFGHGLINAPRAVAAALARAGGAAPPSPVLHVSSHALNFGDQFVALPLEVSNTGGGTLEIVGVSTDVPWLSVSPGVVGDNRVRVDRGAAFASSEVVRGASWQAIGRLTLTSNVGSVSVMVRVSSADEPGALGPLVVVLLDAERDEIVARAAADPMTGYAFDFEDVPPGVYRLVAGSDWSATGRLGHAGEAYGELGFGGAWLCVGGVSHERCRDGDDPEALWGSIELLTLARAEPFAYGSPAPE